MMGSQRWIARFLVCVGIGGILVSGVAIDTAVATGQETFHKRCQGCHGADGAGNPNMAKMLKVTIPPVNGAALEKMSDADLLHIIADGKGKMPAFAKKLSEEERQEVLEYMKTLGH